MELKIHVAMTLEITFTLVVIQIKHILIIEVKTYKDLYTQADILYMQWLLVCCALIYDIWNELKWRI